MSTLTYRPDNIWAVLDSDNDHDAERLLRFRPKGYLDTPSKLVFVSDVAVGTAQVQIAQVAPARSNRRVQISFKRLGIPITITVIHLQNARIVLATPRAAPAQQPYYFSFYSPPIVKQPNRRSRLIVGFRLAAPRAVALSWLYTLKLRRANGAHDQARRRSAVQSVQRPLLTRHRTPLCIGPGGKRLPTALAS